MTYQEIAEKVSKGAALFDSGKAHLAFPVINEAIKLAEQHNEKNLLAKALCNRGSCYQASNQNTEALDDYERAIELNPKDPITIFNRGELLAHLGNFSEAKEDLFRAAELDISLRSRILYTLKYYKIKYDDNDITW